MRAGYSITASGRVSTVLGSPPSYVSRRNPAFAAQPPEPRRVGPPRPEETQFGWDHLALDRCPRPRPRHPPDRRLSGRAARATHTDPWRGHNHFFLPDWHECLWACRNAEGVDVGRALTGRRHGQNRPLPAQPFRRLGVTIPAAEMTASVIFGADGEGAGEGVPQVAGDAGQLLHRRQCTTDFEVAVQALTDSLQASQDGFDDTRLSSPVDSRGHQMAEGGLSCIREDSFRSIGSFVDVAGKGFAQAPAGDWLGTGGGC